MKSSLLTMKQPLRLALQVGVCASCFMTQGAAAQFVEPDAQALQVLKGDQTGDYFGWLAANVGDSDGDGIDDAAIGAIADGGFAGRVTVFSGADGSRLSSAAGAPGSALGYGVANAGDVNGDGVPDYAASGGQVLVFSGLDHTLLLDLDLGGEFADCVDGAGDVDGDGFGDLVVGSLRTAAAGANAGRAWLFSGDDGSLLWTVDGAPGDTLGSAVGGIGDVNGDGVPDVVAGAAGAGPFDGGEARVLSGADGGLIRHLRPLDEKNAKVFGTFFASGGGDLDRDGVGDVFIGDLDATVDGQASTGNVHVYSGRTGHLLRLIQGVSAGEGFGLGGIVADANGDHYPDLLIGAFNNGRGATRAGAGYLFSGRSGALLRTITSTTESENFGGDAIGLGDTNNDGLPDFLFTAPGLGFLGLDAGSAYLISGTVLPCPADLNGNGWVGFGDLLHLKWAWGQTDGDGKPIGDLNGDGKVDGRDFVVLLRDRGPCAPGFPSAP